jgi:hypothetical protein
MNSIAMEQGPGKANLIPAQVRHCRTDGSITDRNSDHETQGKATIHDRLAEFGSFHVLSIDVQWRRIMRHRAEPDIVGLRYRSPDRMIERLADRKFLEKKTWHI